MSELWYKLVETSSVCPLITHLSGLLVRPGLGQGREVSGVADAGEAGLGSGLRGLDGQGRGRAPEQKVLQFPYISCVPIYCTERVISLPHGGAADGILHIPRPAHRHRLDHTKVYLN